MTPAAETSASISKRPKTILLGAGDRPLVAETIAALQPVIGQHLDVVGVDLTSTVDIEALGAELAIVFGGDGSIIRAVRQMAYRQLPVLGVNLGKLGFLADLSPSELVHVLPELATGRLKVIRHLMFECRVERQDGSVIQQLGLNDIVVHAGPPFTLLSIDLYVDAELATTYSCDGLILATPVGSTAHSLSAGGPILRKDLQAFVISPICPHTLTNRPVVDTAERVFELVIPRPNEGTAVVVDGKLLTQLLPGDRVRVERAKPSFELVQIAGHTYYRTLREKLGWGGHLRPGC